MGVSAAVVVAAAVAIEEGIVKPGREATTRAEKQAVANQQAQQRMLDQVESRQAEERRQEAQVAKRNIAKNQRSGTAVNPTGRQSTILTSPMGIPKPETGDLGTTGSASTTTKTKKTLLGS